MLGIYILVYFENNGDDETYDPCKSFVSSGKLFTLLAYLSIYIYIYIYIYMPSIVPFAHS